VISDRSQESKNGATLAAHARAGKTQVKLEEFLAIIEQLPLHKDPRAELQDAFSIFDMCVCVCVCVCV
jgi:Ca2+-binding EF-hand superfamily protein